MLLTVLWKFCKGVTYSVMKVLRVDGVTYSVTLVLRVGGVIPLKACQAVPITHIVASDGVEYG